MRRAGESMKRPVVIVFVLVLVAAGGFLLSLLEFKEEEVYVGYQGEARRNPLVALERTATELGLPSTSRRSLDELPPRDHCLVVLGSGEALGAERVGEVLGWVAGGGHGIFLFPSGGAYHRILVEESMAGLVKDPLLTALDVDLVGGELLDEEDLVWGEPYREPELEGETSGEGEPFAGHRALQLDPDGLRFVVAEGTVELAYPPWEDEPAYLLHFELGDGALTLVSESEWAENQALAQAEHAEQAWDLLQLDGPRRGAWFVYRFDVPGFWAWLFGSGVPLLLSAFLLLALWLWRSGARFGPLAAELPTDRRDFAEHLDAAGEFFWRQKLGAALLEAQRRHVERRVQALRPAWSRLSPEERREVQAEVSGLSPAAVGEALDANAVTHPQQFTRVVRNLRSLEETL